MTDTADTPRPLARAPRGFPDKRAATLRAERAIIGAVTAVYDAYGFEPLETPSFEYADALGKFLPDADRPNAGVFALQDDDEQWMALRYDHTAPLARFAAENWQTLAKPYRRYAYGPVWRNEKPGPGRYREFIQCDADIVGSASPVADAEICLIAAAGLQAAGLAPEHITIKINSRLLLNAVLAKAGIADEGQKLTVLRALDKLDRLGADGVRALLGPGRKDESGDFTKGAGLDAAQSEHLLAFVAAGQSTRAGTLQALTTVLGDAPGAAEGLVELAAMDSVFTGLAISDSLIRFDPAIVRGLDYYTGAVFEAELNLEIADEKGNPIRFGAVGGGGRYDDLVARFTGERVPATGFSFGVSRLAAALNAAGQSVATTEKPLVVILNLEPDQMAAYMALAAQIRDAGLAAEVYLGSSGMKAQMKYADRRNAMAVIIIGDREREAGEVTIKDLEQGRARATEITDNAAWKAERPGQVTVPAASLIDVLSTIAHDRD
jgi:histidyl-tRNA synthetase